MSQNEINPLPDAEMEWLCRQLERDADFAKRVEQNIREGHERLRQQRAMSAEPAAREERRMNIITAQAEQLFLDEEMVVADYRKSEDGTLYSVLGFTNPELRMNHLAYLSLPGDYHEGAKYRLRLTLDCLAENELDQLECDCR